MKDRPHPKFSLVFILFVAWYPGIEFKIHYYNIKLDEFDDIW